MVEDTLFGLNLSEEELGLIIEKTRIISETAKNFPFFFYFFIVFCIFAPLFLYVE